MFIISGSSKVKYEVTLPATQEKGYQSQKIINVSNSKSASRENES